LLPTGHDSVSAVLVLTSAILPAVALIANTPVASGVGRLTVPAAPAACCTSRYWPGLIDSAGNVVTCHVAPVALVYCTDQPSRFTAVGVLLYSSTKSLRNVAPLLPPPP